MTVYPLCAIILDRTSFDPVYSILQTTSTNRPNHLHSLREYIIGGCEPIPKVQQSPVRAHDDIVR